MKSHVIISLLLLLSVSGAKAQGVLVGDANLDGQLTIADVTATTNLLLGKGTRQYVYTQECFIRNNALTGTYILQEGDTQSKRTYVCGYEYVDLGLSSGTYWCATDIGGLTYSDLGTQTTWSGAAALIPVKSGWALPTEAQIEELLSGCNVTETALNGQKYIRFACKTDDTKYILIPEACSYLWSSTEADATEADALYVQSAGSVDVVPVLKTSACYVRPVIKKTDIPGSSSGSGEISQGEDNADTYSKMRIDIPSSDVYF